MILYRLLFIWLILVLGQCNVICAQSILITGEVREPLKVTPDILSKIQRHTVNLPDRSGHNRLFSGVAIYDVLKLADVTLGKQLRGSNLTKYVLVKCADGYEVLFSLAELDLEFIDRKVILADTVDGESLPESMGPYRIVVSGENKQARSAHQVIELTVRYAHSD